MSVFIDASSPAHANTSIARSRSWSWALVLPDAARPVFARRAARSVSVAVSASWALPCASARKRCACWTHSCVASCVSGATEKRSGGGRSRDPHPPEAFRSRSVSAAVSVAWSTMVKPPSSLLSAYRNGRREKSANWAASGAGVVVSASPISQPRQLARMCASNFRVAPRESHATNSPTASEPIR